MASRIHYAMYLRRAVPDDMHEIASIHRTARAVAVPWLPVVHTAQDGLWFFTKRVLPVQQVYVVRIAEKIVGFAAHHEGWLNHLYIDAGYWRQGLGGLLLVKAQSVNDTLQLWTFARNLAAQAFYARAGFQIVEHTDGRDNEERTPDVRMRWAKSDH
ncbi:GNAT family N-acetyltransferase [uncultured Sulfitobacter sp.]|uniref:GNAT family N-acetyltransferase n=1 Tax=uncultured Sulfitobacter sp. TaxID=191468 RepID=UPI00262E6FEB|nr:GNAT family N-acetyltransferase [uncultured Sulfitobacter sp.]